MAASAAWTAAVAQAVDVVSDLDVAQLLGAIDELGIGTWRLMEILLERLRGKPIALLDKEETDGPWRRVLLVAREGAATAELRTEAG